MKKIIILLTFVIVTFQSLGQSKSMSFQNAEKQGISFEHLDSLYKSAVHSDIKLAVFKTAEEQANLQKAYVGFLQRLGSFLKSHQFKWEKQTRCYNRIYFNSTGTVDYFFYNFGREQISAEKEEEFGRLLNIFVKDHKFSLTASENFAQCSPVKYSDQ
jgi:hypothetical protein